MTRVGPTSAADPGGVISPDVPDTSRALSFGSIADTYHRYRPRTPAALLDWLLPSGAHDVIDLAAGTGALTELLVQRAASVVAVEPDPGMREVLAQAAPAARILAGTAEQIPLPDEAADALFVSSAWHWFDPERAVPEIARVLRDGGRLGVLRNSPDSRVDWVGALRQRKDADQRERPRHDVRLPQGAPFAEPSIQESTWLSPMSVDDVLNLLSTYSEVIVDSPQGRRQTRERAASVLAEHPQTRGRDVLDVPMVSWAWRADRLPRQT